MQFALTSSNGSLGEAMLRQEHRQVLRFPKGTFLIINDSQTVVAPQVAVAPIDVMLSQFTSGNGEVEIHGLGPSGRLSAGGETALIRVKSDGAPVLLSYHTTTATGSETPSITVRKVSNANGDTTLTTPTVTEAAVSSHFQGSVMVCVQGQGDIWAESGQWLGDNSGQAGIEGFSIQPLEGLASDDITYQAIFGPKWETPSQPSGTYCGSKEIDLPINGLRIRLSAAATAMYDFTYSGLFVDGTIIGPVAAGEICACHDFKPLIGLQIVAQKRLC
jgi:hypothetical protein